MPVNTTIEGVLSLKESQIIYSRTVVALLTGIVAVAFPIFYKVMGLMGAALSFLIAVIMPTMCFISLEWRNVNLAYKVSSVLVLACGFGFMGLGTLGVLAS